jgi:oxygen-independent coproporphyrinogen-3 oxidase
MGLRLEEGVDLARLVAETGVEALVDAEAVNRLAGHGLVKRDDSRLQVTPAGMLVLDRILAEIVA